jgi:formylglycine-generating enzyme required for sulfatase activity
MALRRAYGGPAEDPEAIPDAARFAMVVAGPDATREEPAVQTTGWSVDLPAAVAPAQGRARGERTVDLGGGVTMRLVRVPAGRFVMGDPEDGAAKVEAIDEPFWMGACEVTNEQLRRFDPAFDCRYYAKRHARSDDQGMPLNGGRQPAVRVSWEQAMAFCRWLSDRTGMSFTLPSEAQWEYACRAGSKTLLHYGDVDADFSAWGNMGDLSFSDPNRGDYIGITGGLEHAILEGSGLGDRRFDDGYVVTAPVGQYRPNAWGLHDMHGNAAEWTRSPYVLGEGDEAIGPGRRVVRGGSFFDPPKRCGSAVRLGYPAWQRVFNVGFRVVCEGKDTRQVARGPGEKR